MKNVRINNNWCQSVPAFIWLISHEFTPKIHEDKFYFCGIRASCFFFLTGNFPSCCYLPLLVQALSVCTPCQVPAMPACWQVNERSHRSSCFFPGDTHCPHSVSIKKPNKMPRTSKTVHYGLPGGRADTIKERYRLQIMHVSSLILISLRETGQRGDVQMHRRDLACRITRSLLQTKDICSAQRLTEN